MVIASLIIAIGLIPLVLAINVLRIYKGSELGIALLLFMLSISLWQIDIGVLYLKDFLPENVILLLFRLFRVGPTFIVPLTFYLTYLIIKKHAPNFKNTTWYKLTLSLFNTKVLCLFFVWTIAIYVLNWTKFGIEGLRVVNVLNTDTRLYFPTYGEFHSLYLLHTSIFLFLLIFIFIISRGIQNVYLQSFLSTFSFCSMLLFVTGFLNFIPGTGAIFSSMGVIVFSSIIVFSFVKMNNLITLKYNRLIERQKKLDYTGDIATSLIHEVKNNLQIIKAYSKLLHRTASLPKQSIEMVEMIQKSTQQLEDLTHSYTEYLNTKTIEFKLTDLNEAIKEAIDITSEIIKENRVKVSFLEKYKPLKAYVSDTYLKQVFVNLIKNSCESINDEDKQREIIIYTQIKDDQIIIDISDTGEGIPIDQWEYIFDPFISSKNAGMGVGLPFVRKIIFEHRGEIKVLESSLKGTTLRIVLPQYEFSDFN
ncbi:sensor histidine kinase [Alkalihalobacillus deserti]|uniref:sensor histidine kinase n=1 Tax=Alkalihalobacillus deserti TaxID=2879466 RepID=UPI001D1339AA|nr:HAMP domain-containing sensor histidine kinase [Alkalihalobacillus deserti]